MTFTGVDLAWEEQVWMGSGGGEARRGRGRRPEECKHGGCRLTPALVAGFCGRGGGRWLQVRGQVCSVDVDFFP